MNANLASKEASHSRRSAGKVRKMEVAHIHLRRFTGLGHAR